MVLNLVLFPPAGQREAQPRSSLRTAQAMTRGIIFVFAFPLISDIYIYIYMYMAMYAYIQISKRIHRDISVRVLGFVRASGLGV